MDMQKMWNAYAQECRVLRERIAALRQALEDEIKEKAEQDIEYGKARFRSYRNNVSKPVHDSNHYLLYSSGNAYCIYNAVCRQCV